MLKYLFPLFVIGFPARSYADPIAIADPETHASAPGVAVDEGVPLLSQRADVDTHSLHFDAGFGADFGNLKLPSASATTGLHMSIGARRGRFALLGELTLLAIDSQSSNALGLYERVAIEPRLSLWQRQTGDGQMFEVYVEPGIGLESVSAPNMPTFTRRDLSAAVGIQRTIQLGARRLTVYGAARAMAAPAERGLGEHGADLSLMLTSGVMIGR